MSVRRLLPFIAILLSLATTLEIASRVYLRLPRLEDELANLFQARVFASGRLYAPSPEAPEAFGVPFVLDLDGRRFSKYPPGESLILAPGVAIGDAWVVGPFLGALALASIYRLAKDLFDVSTARWSLALALTSPFFLILTPTLMPHPAAMLAAGLCGVAFFHLRRAGTPTSRLALGGGAGFALGVLFLTRPHSVPFLAVPFALLALRDLRSDVLGSIGRYTPMALSFVPFVLALPFYNLALTGEWRLSLYTLWWPFDRLGFGADVGPRGFDLAEAIAKTGRDLYALSYDLHGVPYLSLLPLVLGLVLGLRLRSRAETFLALLLAALVASNLFYHSSSRLYGPRYLYEALPAMVILGGRGLSGVIRRAAGRNPFRPIAYMALALFFGINLVFFLPFRLRLLGHLHDDALNWEATGAVRESGLQDAVVFLFADDWPEAAAGIIANDPDLRASVIYARYLGPESYRIAIAAHPDRVAYFWRDGVLSPASDPPPDWFPEYPTLQLPKP